MESSPISMESVVEWSKIKAKTPPVPISLETIFFNFFLSRFNTFLKISLRLLSPVMSIVV